MSEAANNPWIVRESGKRVALPENQSYFVDFLGIEECEITLKQTGEKKPKWRFLWKVKTGEYAGTTDTLTERDISPDTQAGVLIAGLIGHAIKPGDNVKELAKACIGQDYIGLAQKGKQGGAVCIRSVSKKPEGM